MYKHIRNWLFKVDAERVHHWVMLMLLLGYKLPFVRTLIKKKFTVAHPSLERNLWGIHFPNPVGLAAGFDKNAKFTDALSCLGFGHIEIGTLTPKAQPGNDKPRLFRLPKDRALINRMGFNNHGVNDATERLAKRKESIIIGGNIGKNKVTPNEEASDDYVTCFKALYEQVDYFVVNVSSPNTPGLRELQEKAPLTQLLKRLQDLNKQMGDRRPILLKIAPDLTNEQLDDIIEIVQTTHLHGIVATNTTIARNGLNTDGNMLEKIGAGGLSGAPVKNRSTEVIRYIALKSQGKIPIIAVGGIFTGAEALEKLNAGASLVQVYTGFIYEGPAIVRNICKSLLTSSK